MTKLDSNKAQASAAPALPNLTLERYVDELLTTTNSDSWPVLISTQGTFQRSYREDILAVVPPVGQTETIRIDVAREGLYDMLPEGVFHESPPGGGRHRYRSGGSGSGAAPAGGTAGPPLFLAPGAGVLPAKDRFGAPGARLFPVGPAR